MPEWNITWLKLLCKDPNEKSNKYNFSLLSITCKIKRTYTTHSSENRGLRSTFWPRDTSKFARYVYVKRKSMVFYILFQATLSFTFINAVVYVDIDQGIHKVKMWNCLKWKRKTTWVFFSIDMVNFEAFFWGIVSLNKLSFPELLCTFVFL